MRCFLQTTLQSGLRVLTQSTAPALWLHSAGELGRRIVRYCTVVPAPWVPWVPYDTVFLPGRSLSLFSLSLSLSLFLHLSYFLSLLCSPSFFCSALSSSLLLSRLSPLPPSIILVTRPYPDHWFLCCSRISVTAASPALVLLSSSVRFLFI